MKNYYNVLKTCPLFFGIDEKDMPNALKCLDAKICNYQKNEMIFTEGDIADKMGIVVSGKVQIFKMDYNGNKSIVASITAPEIFGEAFFCADIKNLPVSVIATEKSSVVFLKSDCILNSDNKKCHFENIIIFNLLKIVAKKNIAFNRKIEITSKRTTREKLLTYLSIKAKENNSNSFFIPFNRQELADYLEVERSGLSAEISRLRKEKVLESNKNKFLLL